MGQRTHSVGRGSGGYLGEERENTPRGEEDILEEESKIPRVVTHPGGPHSSLQCHLLPPSPHPLCALAPLNSLLFGYSVPWCQTVQAAPSRVSLGITSSRGPSCSSLSAPAWPRTWHFILYNRHRTLRSRFSCYPIFQTGQQRPRAAAVAGGSNPRPPGPPSVSLWVCLVLCF